MKKWFRAWQSAFRRQWRLQINKAKREGKIK